jgi:isoleucyl-tRNA synthetase
VVPQVQNARKDAKLDLLNKIALHLCPTTPELAKALTEHQQTIATAVQATQWSDALLTGDGVYTATVKIDGQPLTIMLRKV